MSFAAVHIPEFPVAAWLQSTPALKSQAAVLLHGSPPMETVFSMNGVAQAFGIKHGMSKVQAEAVCTARFRGLDSQEEQRAFDTVHELVSRFSPRIELVAAPVNEYAGQRRPAAAVLLDRSGTDSLFGTAQAYAQRLKYELKCAGFEGSVATAPNAEAALMLSRSCKGVLCVSRSELRHYLAPLPTSLLPCDEKMQMLLRRWV